MNYLAFRIPSESKISQFDVVQSQLSHQDITSSQVSMYDSRGESIRKLHDHESDHQVQTLQTVNQAAPENSLLKTP